MSFLMLPLYYMSDDPEVPTSSGDSEGSIQDAPTPKPYQLLAKNQLPEKCAVCRNPSIGYHYNVASCSGCKTFFRRTIVEGKRFICLSGRDCLEGTQPMDVTKRMCRACRFAKCVEVGMSPTAIRTAVKTIEGRFLLEEVVRKQRIRGIDGKTMSNDDFLAKMIEKLTILEDESDKLHINAIPLEFEDLRTLSEILTQPTPSFNSNRIPNLTRLPKKRPEQNCKSYMHSGVLAVVEYTKTFQFSSKLSLEARITLIKHVALIGSIMASASFSMHHRKSDALVYPDGSIAGLVLNCLSGDRWTKYRMQLQKTLHAFLSNKVDRVEYMLLKAIVVSNPAISGLSLEDQQAIEAERNEYGRALFNYCILQHGVTNGPSRLATLISMISVAEMQSKSQKDFYIMMKATTTDRGCKTPVRNMFDEVMDP